MACIILPHNFRTSASTRPCERGGGGGYARFVVAYVLSSHSVVVSSVTRGLLRVNGMAMVLVTVQAEPVVRDGRPCLG